MPIIMARPKKNRKVTAAPRAYYFKPRAIPLCELEESALELDEFQAIKHADLERLDQVSAAAKMKVSRQTFGNILASARRKLADAVVHGKALRIGDGALPECLGKI